MNNTTGASFLPKNYQSHFTTYSHPMVQVEFRKEPCSENIDQLSFNIMFTSEQISDYQKSRILETISREIESVQNNRDNKMENVNQNLPQVFTFESDKQIRTLTENNEIYFVAKDVAEALEYSSASLQQISNLISHIPEQWKGHKLIMVPQSGIQEMNCLTEQGVNFFVFRSDKPKALPFQMWLAGKVLPSIRRTGSYSAPGAPSNSSNAEVILSKLEALLDLESRISALESLNKESTRAPKKTNKNTPFDDIEAFIKLSASTEQPITKTGRKTGIYKNRYKLPTPYNKYSRTHLEYLVQTLLDTDRVKKYSIDDSRIQWLDIPGGEISKRCDQ